MRLFVALPLNAAAKAEIIKMQEKLRALGVTGNYTSADNLHVTLAFIGEYDPGSVAGALKNIKFRRFSFTVGGTGSFDRLIWAGVERCPELTALAAEVRKALAEAGIPFDTKPFRPHITVLRKPSFAGKALPVAELRPEVVEADAFLLMRSERGEKGMVYTPVKAFRSAGADQ